jgi:hypothetical protein
MNGGRHKRRHGACHFLLLIESLLAAQGRESYTPNIARRFQVSDKFHPFPKMTDALQPQSNAPAPDHDGAPAPTQATAAEQCREAEESDRAQKSQGGLRDRLVEIGKAHHMAGRGNGRVSDA